MEERERQHFDGGGWGGHLLGLFTSIAEKEGGSCGKVLLRVILAEESPKFKGLQAGQFLPRGEESRRPEWPEQHLCAGEQDRVRSERAVPAEEAR